MQSVPRRTTVAGRRARAAAPQASTVDLDAPLAGVLSGSPRDRTLFRKLGIETARQALWYLPFRYDDFSDLRPLGDLVPEQKQSARVTVVDVQVEKGFGRRPQRVVAQLADDTGSAEAIWFGRRFVERRLHSGDEVIVSGRVVQQGWRPQFVSPDFSPLGHASLHTGRVAPVYPLVAGTSQYRLREALARLLERCLPGMVDPLRPGERVGLEDLAAAFRHAHFPEGPDDLRAALDRLAFEELLALQLTLALARQARQQQQAPVLKLEDAAVRTLVAALPFALTPDQDRAVGEILADLSRPEPMRRLLQGDVGSGKTAVAAIALAATARAGWQGALMAPTEILARQHHAGLAPLLGSLGLRVELLAASIGPTQRRRIHADLEAGAVDVAIGTHAVISDAVRFRRLGLAVVDEQHRFGVAQRGALQAKGTELEPHVLALTATPIPRTLAMTLYADLGISSLHEMPPGRQPVRTEVRDRLALPRIEAFLASEAAAGRQSFVVVPLIDQSESLSAASAEREAERLRLAWPGLRIGLVHGQQPADARDATMRQMAEGSLDVLVATTVVEVGIDIPNASVMVVQDAERFGLAQLHQLRGRVGRGAHRSFCILVSDTVDPLARRRLEVVRDSSDGFAIAEQDLQLRGAGNLLGTRQSGLPPLRVASLFDVRHLELAERARVLASGLVASGTALVERPELAREMQGMALLAAGSPAEAD